MTSFCLHIYAMNSIIYVSDGDAKVIIFKGVTHKLIFISINYSVVVYSYITFWTVFFFNFLDEDYKYLINILIFFIAEEEVVEGEIAIVVAIAIVTVVAIDIVVDVAAEVCNNQNM